jgi:hypothetical protein
MYLVSTHHRQFQERFFLSNIKFHRIKSTFASLGIVSIVLIGSSPGVLPIKIVSGFLAEQEEVKKIHTNRSAFRINIFTVVKSFPFLIILLNCHAVHQTVRGL